MTETQYDVTTARENTIIELMKLRTVYNKKLFDLQFGIWTPTGEYDLLIIEQHMKSCKAILLDGDAFYEQLIDLATDTSFEIEALDSHQEFRNDYYFISDYLSDIQPYATVQSGSSKQSPMFSSNSGKPRDHSSSRDPPHALKNNDNTSHPSQIPCGTNSRPQERTSENLASRKPEVLADSSDLHSLNREVHITQSSSSITPNAHLANLIKTQTDPYQRFHDKHLSAQRTVDNASSEGTVNQTSVQVVQPTESSFREKPSSVHTTTKEPLSPAIIAIPSNQIKTDISARNGTHKSNIPVTHALKHDSSNETVDRVSLQVVQSNELSFREKPSTAKNSAEELPPPSSIAIPSNQTETEINVTNGTQKLNLPGSQTLKHDSSNETVDGVSFQVVQSIESSFRENSSIVINSTIHDQKRVSPLSNSDTVYTTKTDRRALTFLRYHPIYHQDLKESQHLISTFDIASNNISTSLRDSQVRASHDTPQPCNIQIADFLARNISGRLHRKIRFLFSKRVKLKTHSTDICYILTSSTRHGHSNVCFTPTLGTSVQFAL